jgi:succinate dehydrogenase / fumarate reductase cytochrome b subunit
MIAFFKSTLGLKYLMALSGFALVGFIFIHMVGNLQTFLGQDVFNEYAYKLQTLPAPILWGFRAFLLAAVAVHVITAIALARQNRKARPVANKYERVKQASWGSRSMGLSGVILISFVVFHILHFTTKSLFDYSMYKTVVNGTVFPDVYSILIAGFDKPLVAIFYIVAMALLCLHLTHGVTSMFQTLGLRNKKWKPAMDKFAITYGWIIFIGFIANPVAVMTGILQKPENAGQPLVTQAETIDTTAGVSTSDITPKS